MPKWARIILIGTASIGLLCVALYFSANGSFGGAPNAEDKRRRVDSPQWKDGAFVNQEPMYSPIGEAFMAMFEKSAFSVPAEPMTKHIQSRQDLPLGTATETHAVWLGHSTLFLAVEGERFLIDPVFDHRPSPWAWIGPAAWYSSPIQPEQIDELDAVLISHDHYDHLSMNAITALLSKTQVFVAPLGIQSHLRAWGVPDTKIVALDWWEEHKQGSVTVTLTPARHASGRDAFDFNQTLWGGFSIRGKTRSVYVSGDTGWTPAFQEIRDRLGPFEMTFFEVGAYHRAWPDWHLGPEHAVTAHQVVGGDLLIPIHWGRFDLALHGWTEPAERVRVAVERSKQRVHFPKPGEHFKYPNTQVRRKPWWPNLPWDDESVHPIPTTKQGIADELANVP